MVTIRECDYMPSNERFAVVHDGFIVARAGSWHEADAMADAYRHQIAEIHATLRELANA